MSHRTSGDGDSLSFLEGGGGGGSQKAEPETEATPLLHPAAWAESASSKDRTKVASCPNALTSEMSENEKSVHHMCGSSTCDTSQFDMSETEKVCTPSGRRCRPNSLFASKAKCAFRTPKKIEMFETNALTTETSETEKGCPPLCWVDGVGPTPFSAPRPSARTKLQKRWKCSRRTQGVRVQKPNESRELSQRAHLRNVGIRKAGRPTSLWVVGRPNSFLGPWGSASSKAERKSRAVRTRSPPKRRWSEGSQKAEP